MLDEGAGPVAVMSVLPGPDPTYARIEGEPWLNDEPYWVMHRLAVAEPGHGRGARMLAWLCGRHDNVRADTPRGHVPMQRALERAGFRAPRDHHLRRRHPRIAYHSSARLRVCNWGRA